MINNHVVKNLWLGVININNVKYVKREILKNRACKKRINACSMASTI